MLVQLPAGITLELQRIEMRKDKMKGIKERIHVEIEFIHFQGSNEKVNN